MHDVKTEDELVVCAADLNVEVMCPTEVEAVNERSACAVRLGIFALVVLEVAVLLNEVPEEVSIAFLCKVDVIAVLRNIHKVIAVAVAVDIAVVVVAVSRG